MVRRKKENKKRPPFGMPKEISLSATPEGWRTSILTMEGGMLCGRLNIPITTDPQDARSAAETKVTNLAHYFHDTHVQVNWEPPQEPWSWTAQVTLPTENGPTPPDIET
ncbi:hypothetical protein [Streptomyces sp. NPDC060333]|uniref:hypothetical protein n=1 Tax=Streptomyces sp. NPDC060333 TaxID=3347098 RepID=UPI00364D93CA